MHRDKFTEKLSRIVETIETQALPVKVRSLYVFGSYARGAIEPGDLKAAEIPYKDEAGRVFDFHSLRHQFISDLARGGVHPKEAQTLARLSTITLTMDRYTHVGIVDLISALDRLPAIADDSGNTRGRQAGRQGDGLGSWERKNGARIGADGCRKWCRSPRIGHVTDGAGLHREIPN